MAEAMKGADAQLAQVLEQANNSGASQAQIDAIDAMLGNRGQSAVTTDDALVVVPLDRSETVGEYDTDVYVARAAAGVEKYRLYMVDIDKVAGGRGDKEDLQRSTRTAITGASAAVPDVDFAPECEKQDMMSY